MAKKRLGNIFQNKTFRVYLEAVPGVLLPRKHLSSHILTCIVTKILTIHLIELLLSM